MRILTPICALLLLTACTEQKTPVHDGDSVRPFGGGSADDSSPIIISDGSISIRHSKNGKLDHFRVHGPQHASVKQAGYQPYYLGWGCSVNSQGTGCQSTCVDSAMVSPCKVSLIAASSWTLALCETPSPCTAATVQIAWDNSADAEKLDITSNDNQNFEIKAPSGNRGTDLHHISSSSQHLQSAALTVTDSGGHAGAPYNFACASGQDCVNLAYACFASGDLVCGK
jgi:hypothetical protein